jgi:hypothetical protein
MSNYTKFLYALIIITLMSNCEADEDQIPSGYVVSSLFEINGKQKIDHTAEIEPCRVKEVWVFKLPQKEVFHSYDAVDCPPAPWKAGYTEPFDTGYVDSLRGRFFILPSSGLRATTPPMVHKDFPIRFPNYDYMTHVLYYPLIKFDQNEVVIRNQFDYRKIPKDTQYFELTLKYVEQ